MTDIRQDLIGNSPQIVELIRLIGRAARSNSTVLIQGETGTGKELVAKAIHSNGTRSNGPFVAVNCAAIPAELLESEFFGHARGSFTGALTDKPGEFERASGGTLFLDEVGELALPLQAKILRALQEKEIKRVGASRSIKVDVRIIAATNRDLRSDFRSDLYYRLNVISIKTPALRERPSDILLLAQHFLSMYERQETPKVVGISTDAKRILESYDWPGNVRELQHAIEQAVMMGTSDLIVPQDLSDNLRRNSGVNYVTGVETAKRQLLDRAFTIARGNHNTASELLGLHPIYVYSLIKKLNMSHLRKVRSAQFHG